MDKPLVSVVIATYNIARYLPLAVKSALDQTYRNIEVVVVDDGSTDGTAHAIEPLLEDPRLRYCRQENKGQAAAKNRGIRESRGAYIAFLDADDVWALEKLDFQLPLFSESASVGVVHSRVCYIDDAGKELGVADNELFRGRVSGPLLIRNFIGFGTTVVKKECFDHLGGFKEDLRMGIDYDIWLRFSTQYEFDFVDRPLLYYRIWPGQMSKDLKTRYLNGIEIMKNFLRDFPGVVDKNTESEAWAHTYVGFGQSMQETPTTWLRVESLYSGHPIQTELYSSVESHDQGDPTRVAARFVTSIQQTCSFWSVVRADLRRYGRGLSPRSFIKQFLFTPGFRYTFWMRLAFYLRQKGSIWRPCHYLCRIFLSRCGVRFGISIPYNTRIGPGLYIGHYGGIVVNYDVVIGRDCNINHEVTIGAKYGGKNPGVPVIGDRVFLGPGCKVIGGISLGNDVAVGANSVVVESVPNSAVTAGVPAKVMSLKGSSEYVVNTQRELDETLCRAKM